jgi:isocitrate/isopropylmalate dehydrogenase
MDIAGQGIADPTALLRTIALLSGTTQTHTVS